MSVREEERKKSSCSSRGLGLAAAAIGVGVGAALYYYFNKRPENPNGEGSTTGWNCEQSQTLSPSSDQEDSYVTISENDTTDTSMHSSIDSPISHNSSHEDESTEDWNFLSNLLFGATESNDSTITDDDRDESEDEYESSTSQVWSGSSDSDLGDWDVTNSSIGLPDGSMLSTPLFAHIQNLVSPVWIGRRENETVNEEHRNRIHGSRRLSEEQQMQALRQQALLTEEQLLHIRQQAFRERSWSLEECSICCDLILKDQKVTTLPCTHNFHEACLAPWLEEHQTCPNCRKAAE